MRRASGDSERRGDRGGKAIGLIERERLYSRFSQPLWLDVYNRRLIAPLVTRAAMVVDGARPIEGVKELIA